MSHCDPEMLALRSLGEVVGTPEEDAHLASCEQCQAELASLREVVVVAKTAGPQQAVEAPPAHVWERIAAEVGAPAVPARHAAGVVPPPATPVDEPVQPATITSLDSRRRRPRTTTWLLAAAGVGGIAVGGIATAVVLSTPGEPAVTVAATTDLEPLPAWDAAGTADLTVAEDGTRVLVVSLTAPAASSAEGFQEVWLIDTAVEGMVSLGNLEGDTGEFVIPDGVEVGEFPIVDVSLEPFDGDPTHSGDSIVRGTLDV